MHGKLFTIVLIAICCRGIQSNYIDELLGEEFRLFQLQFDKQYQSYSEHEFRLQNYLENRLMISRHNQKYHQGLTTYLMGINQFADRGDEELMEMFDHGLGEYILNSNFSKLTLPNPPQSEPESMDWRDIPGYVSPVRDQGKCNAAFAFSLAGATEGPYRLYSGEGIVLSVQQLLDCLPLDCNFNYQNDYVKKAGTYFYLNGLVTDDQYPYNASVGECKFNPDKTVVTPNGLFNVYPTRNESVLQHFLGYGAPTSAIIDGDQKSFIFYKEGIYICDECSTEVGKQNFPVLVVGYGTDKTTGIDYYILRNSWGTQWGEDGYLRLARNRNNQCGIANFNFQAGVDDTPNVAI